MRAFIAIKLPKYIIEEVSKIQEILKKCNLNFKWVKAENTHLTLKFLGNTDNAKLEKAKEIIAQTAKDFSGFKVKLESFGFFPNERRPRVFFISTTAHQILKSIADKLEDELKPLGFKKESRFKSHITLARIKSTKDIDCLKEKLKSIELKGSFPVKEITLYESTLTPKGAIYDVIFNASFAS